jgi:hypothetical protein
MAAKKASEHIRIVLGQLEKVRPMNEDDRTKAIYRLYHLFKAIQGGAEIVAPLYPATDRATALVEAYRKTLKPSDILDDDPGPFMLAI